VKYALAGSWALSFNNIIRATIDIDIVVRFTKDNLSNTVEGLLTLGLGSVAPLAVNDFISETETSESSSVSELYEWRFINPLNPIETVDILSKVSYDNLSYRSIFIVDTLVPYLDMSGLLATKNASLREQDIIDVRLLNHLTKA
jgi:hypothetical protein